MPPLFLVNPCSKYPGFSGQCCFSSQISWIFVYVFSEGSVFSGCGLSSENCPGAAGAVLPVDAEDKNAWDTLTASKQCLLCISVSENPVPLPWVGTPLRCNLHSRWQRGLG